MSTYPEPQTSDDASHREEKRSHLYQQTGGDLDDIHKLGKGGMVEHISHELTVEGALETARRYADAAQFLAEQANTLREAARLVAETVETYANNVRSDVTAREKGDTGIGDIAQSGTMQGSTRGRLDGSTRGL